MAHSNRYPQGMPTTRLATFIWSTLFACMLLTACSDNDDAQQIRALIDEGASLAEAHEVGAILKLATADVRAMPMDLDRRGIRAVLWRTFNHYGPLAVLYPRPAIEIHAAAARATAEVPLLLVKKEFEIPGLDALRSDPLAWIEAVGDQADLYRLRLQWIKDGRRWLVDMAVVERFDGAGFTR
jgi:hypothetical protein